MNYSKRIISSLLTVIIFVMCCVLGINFYVIFSQCNNILQSDEISAMNDSEYILVLGCGVFGDKPSDMLEDRLLKALEIADKIPDVKLIVSGNNSGDDYNEVGVMKNYCISKGFDESRIITDDYGFSTGESITNLSESFAVDKVIIVTQEYHLYRALHIASQYGIEAYGVASDQRNYKMQFYYSLREVAARNKDFVKYFFI